MTDRRDDAAPLSSPTNAYPVDDGWAKEPRWEFGHWRQLIRTFDDGWVDAVVD